MSKNHSEILMKLVCAQGFPKPYLTHNILGTPQSHQIEHYLYEKKKISHFQQGI